VGRNPKSVRIHETSFDIDLDVLQIKYYLEGSGRDSEQVTKTLTRVVEELGDVWMEVVKNKLVVP
jgi:predicted secreted protein